MKNNLKNKKWYKKILKFITKPKNRNLIFFLIFGISIFVNFKACDKIDNLKTEIAVQEHNNKALLDTVETVKNRNGELQQEKTSYITSNKNLREINKELSNEVDKQKGKVIYISNINASLERENKHLSARNSSLEQENKSLRDSLSNFKDKEGKDVYKLHWDFSNQYDQNNFRIIKGYTAFSIDSSSYKPISEGSELEDFNFGFNITTGLKEQDDMLKIFIKSGYPNLTFSNIQGSLIDPHKSDVIKSLMHEDRWTFGVQMGAGLGYFKGGEMKPTVYVGFGGQYKLFGF